MNEKVTKRKYVKRLKTAEQLQYMAKNPSKYFTVYFTAEQREIKRNKALNSYYQTKYSRMTPDEFLKNLDVKALCFGFRQELLLD